MITAKQARENAYTTPDSSIKRKYELILEGIEEASKQGCLSYKTVRLDCWEISSLVKMLKELGFDTVTCNENWLVIRW